MIPVTAYDAIAAVLVDEATRLEREAAEDDEEREAAT
jgi:hypothetical protein